MTSAPGPDGGPEQPSTVRLGPPAGGSGRTARTDGTERTLRIGAAADAGDSATMLDPTAWAAPGAARPTDARPTDAQPQDARDPQAQRQDARAQTAQPPHVPPAHVPPPQAPQQGELFPAEGELRRFGPGVPPVAAAVWHGGAEPARPGRRRWWIVVLLLLLSLAVLAWRWYTPPLAVTAVTAATAPDGPGCDGTAVVTASVITNGRPGTLRYRWLRSDGTTSGELSQSVPAGGRQADLVLRWSFDGHGTMRATATVEILGPGQRRSAATTFDYVCP